MGSTDERVNDQSRRSFVKTAAYVAPVILTLKAAPAFASYGSSQPSSEAKRLEGFPGKSGKGSAPKNWKANGIWAKLFGKVS